MPLFASTSFIPSLSKSTSRCSKISIRSRETRHQLLHSKIQYQISKMLTSTLTILLLPLLAFAGPIPQDGSGSTSSSASGTSSYLPPLLVGGSSAAADDGDSTSSTSSSECCMSFTNPSQQLIDPSQHPLIPDRTILSPQSLSSSQGFTAWLRYND